MNDLKGLKLNEIELKESALDEFAKDFVTKLLIPSVVGFNGSLGAGKTTICLLYTSPSPRDATLSRMPSSA